MRNNDHMVTQSGLKYSPKYLKDIYDPIDIKSYKDVPGWINDAEHIYPLMVEIAKDGDKFVEIGVFLGQSSCRMGELIKESGKNITLDAIDLFWNIPNTIHNYRVTKHPYQFLNYIETFFKMFKNANYDITAIIKHSYIQLGIEKIINLKTVDEIYSCHMYEDNSLQFVWIDGDHTGNIVYKDLIGYWPKIKKGGYIGGDDIVYPDVIEGVNKFIKEFNIPLSDVMIGKDGELLHNSFYIKKG